MNIISTAFTVYYHYVLLVYMFGIYYSISIIYYYYIHIPGVHVRDIFFHIHGILSVSVELHVETTSSIPSLLSYPFIHSYTVV